MRAPRAKAVAWCVLGDVVDSSTCLFHRARGPAILIVTGRYGRGVVVAVGLGVGVEAGAACVFPASQRKPLVR